MSVRWSILALTILVTSAPPVGAADCSTALRRIKDDYTRENTHPRPTIARNSLGQLVAHAGPRPMTDDEVRLMVREALDRLSGSADAVSETMARASTSGLKLTRAQRHVWNEHAKSLPYSATVLRGTVASFQGTRTEYQNAMKVAIGYDKVADTLLQMLKANGNGMPGSTLLNSDPLWNQLSLESAALGLDADVVAASAAVALGDLSNADRYAKDTSDRLARADALIKTAQSNCGIATANGQEPKAEAPNAQARPADSQMSTPAPHAGPGAGKLLAILAVGAGGGAAAIFAAVSAANHFDPGHACGAEQDAAISALQQAHQACDTGAATNAVIIACNNTAAPAAERAVNTYCSCLGKSTAGAGASWTEAISLAQSGQICR